MAKNVLALDPSQASLDALEIANLHNAAGFSPGVLYRSSGVLSFGVFPAVAARFFIYYCGLPDYFHIRGLDFHINTLQP